MVGRLNPSMREVGTGLLRKRGMCAGNCFRISAIRADPVFRGADDQCSHNTNEISALRTEPVFRDVPGKLVERRWQSKRFRGFGLRGAPVDSPGDGVAGVSITPVCLGFLTSRRLAFGIPAGALPTSHSRVGPEPPATDSARSLPGLGHRDDLSSSSRSDRGQPSAQFRMPRSFLVSRGGSILESAEGWRDFFGNESARGHYLDSGAARRVAKALDEAGIRSSQRQRKVGDYVLKELIEENPLLRPPGLSGRTPYHEGYPPRPRLQCRGERQTR